MKLIKKFQKALFWLSHQATNPRFATLIVFLAAATLGMFAAGTGSSNTGSAALTDVAKYIGQYVPAVQKVCYAIAGIVAIVGAISVYMAMQNDEQDVKKKIMMTIGACIFLIAAAQALPKFFGMSAADNANIEVENIISMIQYQVQPWINLAA